MPNRVPGSIAVGFALAVAAAQGQTTAARPSFEVASIKPSAALDLRMILSGQMRIGMKTDAARVDIASMSLMDLICAAYKVKPHQVSGPDWMGGLTGARFDILAKLPDGATTDQIPEMLQGLLEERFKLALHRSLADHPIYALVAGKGGPKLKEAPPDDPAPAADDPKDGIAISLGDRDVKISGSPQGRGLVVSGLAGEKTRISVTPEGTMRMEADRITMPALADFLTRLLDRPVVDMTELKGSYQLTLGLTESDLVNIARNAGVAVPAPGGGKMDAARPADAASDPSGTSSIFAGVQQLGLKLDPRKAPMDLLVIDRLEKAPTAN